jgi:hypothetical protein
MIYKHLIWFQYTVKGKHVTYRKKTVLAKLSNLLKSHLHKRGHNYTSHVATVRIKLDNTWEELSIVLSGT